MNKKLPTKKTRFKKHSTKYFSSAKKEPENLQDFEKNTGWTSTNATNLLVNDFQNRLGGNQKNKNSREKLVNLAGRYHRLLKKYPNHVHVFPLHGAGFQKSFVEGVSKGAGLNNRIEFISPWGPSKQWLEDHARNLNLSKGIVVHDYIGRTTIKQIQKIAKLPESGVVRHNLEEDKVFASGEVPIPGKEYADVGSFSANPFDNIYKLDKCGKGMLKLNPGSKYLSKKQVEFVEDALRSAGSAAIKEYLRKK